MKEQTNANLTVRQKVAERISRFAESWYFVFFFCAFIMVWIIGNKCLGSRVEPLDSYPLLNLIFSCVGCTQGPIIMMSQKRAEKKDRERSKMDFEINLKTESEIRRLHEKIDRLMKVVNQFVRTPELSE